MKTDEKREHKKVFDKLFDTMQNLCVRHDPILVSSVLLAISHKLARTVYDDDEEYLRIMKYMSRNALQVEPFEFNENNNANKTYH